MKNIKCKISDYNILFKSDVKNLEILLKKFLCNFVAHDISVDVLDKDIEYEKKGDIGNISYGSIQRLSAFRKLAEALPTHNAFVLHSATFDVDGVGVAFAAHSGTGKTTHMNLWQQLLGDKMTIVNGDKPIVRFFDEEPNTPYAYGTPWNGKEKLGCNMKTPLKHICFIERSKENFVEKMEPKEAIDRIFNQVYMPKDPVAVMKTTELINRLIHSCSLWKINCNMDISAAETAYNTIFKEK